MRNIYRSVHDIVYTTIIILFEDHALMIQVKLRKYNAEVHSLVEVGMCACPIKHVCRLLTLVPYRQLARPYKHSNILLLFLELVLQKRVHLCMLLLRCVQLGTHIL